MKNKKGFSILQLLIKIIIIAIIIFLILWLLPKSPNLDAFYSNVFRENIKYMQDTAESYFTDDKMPKETGEKVELTLGELIEKKLIIPFVDKDGESCDLKKSYVRITKESDGSYTLKTNLVCPSESDYLLKVLGCHNYCKDNNCSQTCVKELITEYQYKKAVTQTVNSYVCPKDYSRKDKYCYKTYVADTTDTEKETVTKEKLVAADLIVIDGTKTELNVIKEEIPDTVKTIYDTVIKTTKIVTEEYDCSTTETKEVCNTVQKKEYYSCNCTDTQDANGNYVTVCKTCSRTIEVEQCENQEVVVQKTCKNEKTITEYSCPKISTHHTGSKENLKCYHYETIDNGYKYSCPSKANYTVGENETLKCYLVTEGSVKFKCKDKNQTPDENNMCKAYYEAVVDKGCKSGYKLENGKCVKYETDKIKATVKTSQKTTYKYKWSTESFMNGWTKTGKTRIIEGNEICN